MQAADPGLRLHDVHTPAAPAWWPPAPGWWLLFALALLTVVALLWWRRRRARRRAEALAFFDATLAAAGDAPARIAAMSELLRRAARQRDPDADRLQGEDWLRFLDADGKVPVFAAGAGRTLLEGGFRREVGATEYDALRRVVRERFVELMLRRVRRHARRAR